MRKLGLVGVLLITLGMLPGTALADQGLAGLPGYKAVVTPDRRLAYSLSTNEFTFTRVTAPQTGETTITIEGGGAESALVIQLGGPNGLTIERGGRMVVVRPGEDSSEALRMLTGGRAVTAFRYRVGAYERQLANDAATVSDTASPFAYSVLLTAAFVGELAGDPNSLARTRDLIRRRIAAKIRAAAWQQRDCVTDYERALLANDARNTQCMQSADNLDSIFARAAERLLCGAEFLAGAISAEAQFVSCSALKLY
jgi:hypothetical protein